MWQAGRLQAKATLPLLSTKIKIMILIMLMVLSVTLPSLKLLSLLLQLELGSCQKILGSCCLKARVATHVAPGTRGQGSSCSKWPVGRKDAL